MAERYVVVLDGGSSAVRCLVFDRRGEIAAWRSCDWTYRGAGDASPYAREIDADATWRSICEITAQTLHDTGASAGQIAAVTTTGQRQGVVFLDSAGREVYAGPNTDLRAVFEGGTIDEEMGDRVYETTGHTPSFLLAPAKLRWFQLHRPEAYGRIASVITLADWLVFKMSGVAVSEASLAGDAGLLDLGRRSWCTDLLAELGLLDNASVPLADAGAKVGEVTARAARATGIPAGTPVALGGADTQCGLLGSGTSRQHQVGIVAGWSVTLQAVTGRPTLSPEARTWAGCFLTPDRWVVESSSGDAGNSYRWLADTVWGAGSASFPEMDALAADTPVGSEGALAFLGPSRMDMSNLGLRQGGITFPVPLTFSDLGRGHLARAALEAVAYSLKANLRQAEEVSGHIASDIALGGGMTRSPTWVRILADVLGRPLTVSPTPHVSARGAHLCALTAIGDFASLDQAADSVRGALRPVDPDPRDAAEYESHYERWSELAARLQGLGV